MPLPRSILVCEPVKLTGVEWPSMLCEVCAGLTTELVSEIEEQTTLPAEARVKTRCLAMFATPTREHAATETS